MQISGSIVRMLSTSKDSRGVVIAETRRDKAYPLCGIDSDASPAAIANVENRSIMFLRLGIAFPPDRPRISVFEFRAALLELPHRHQHALQNVDRLESRNDDGHAITLHNGLVLRPARNRANMPGPRNACTRLRGRFENSA